MISYFLSIFLICLFSLVPLLLWGYGAIFLSSHVWNRARFFAGIFGGSISILCIFFFRKGLLSTGGEQILAVAGVFIFLGGLTLFIIQLGSPYIRGFLRHTLLLHIGLFCFFLLLFGFFGLFISLPYSTMPFIAGISGFFIAAFLEEGVKHVSSIGLTARDFRFSRTDFLIFTLFVTLGFVMGENILYLIEAAKIGPLEVIFTGTYRILFALPLHIFAASICVIFWWRALSYTFLSWRYISLFIGGFIVATLVHSLYNYLLQEEQFLLLLLSSALAYVTFTQWLISAEKNMLS